MAEDRSWMYTGRQSWSTITPEWADKTTEFVERAFRRVPPGSGLPCPCARCRCRNRLPRSKYDMQIHLGRNGFQPDYTVWPSDDQPEDEEVAGSGEEVPKPQGAKKREITVLHAYASSKLRKEQRIEWEHEHQRYMWEKEKLQQQQQQNAPKRPAIRGSPPPTPLPSLQFTEVARFKKTDQHAGKGSAPMAEDRSWMYTGRQSWSTITPEWADKTTEFVERAFRHVPPGSGLPCPCARCRCRNRLPRSKYDMQIHLGRNGFQPDYTVWPSDDQPEGNGNLDGKKDVEVAGAGEEVPKPQGAKKREITVLHAYASSKLRKEERIEWEHEHQRYMWEKEKLQQQQSAPKRLRTSGAPTAELAEDDEDKDANSCASSSGSI